MAKSSRDAALGCFLGAAVGDAAGAVLEFRDISHIDEASVLTAMQMPGGGAFKVLPGQITDDTELALSLAHGLLTSAPTPGLFPADAVSQEYRYWHSSNPFDIGNTCATAFGASGSTAEEMQKAALISKDSQSNGALMRITPLIVWAMGPVVEGRADRWSVDDLAGAARADALLSHPSQQCQDASAAYTIAAAHLIEHLGDAEGAVAAAEAWAVENACDDVKQWLFEDSKQANELAAHGGTMGWVRYAFALAFYHLRRGSSYEEAIKETLLKGGDTDTNAAIVGGLLGALHGAEGIPEYMKTPVLNSRPTTGITGRQAKYHAASIPQMFEALLLKC